MIIRSLRTIQPANLIILFGVEFLLRIIPIIKNTPIPIETYKEPLSTLLFVALNVDGINHIVNVLLTGLIVVIQALFLNQIVSKYTLFFKSSYLPALMYIIIMNSLAVFMVLTPQLFCNFLLLAILDKIFSLYKTNKAISITFDLGMLFATCSLLYLPYIFLTPIIWLGLVYFRPFSWREWFLGFLGLIVPYFFLFVYFFWNSDMSGFYTLFQPLNRISGLNMYIENNDLYAIIPMLLAFIFSTNKLRANFFKNIIIVRKTYQLLFVLILLSILSFYIPGYAHPAHFAMLTIPMAIYMSYYFLIAKRVWIYEGLAYCILITMLVFQVV